MQPSMEIALFKSIFSNKKGLIILSSPYLAHSYTQSRLTLSLHLAVIHSSLINKILSRSLSITFHTHYISEVFNLKKRLFSNLRLEIKICEDFVRA